MEMLIKNLSSFGIFMLIENTVVLVLLFDLARRVTIKLRFISHPHLYWKSGIIFLAYLLLAFTCNLFETYACYMNYLVTSKSMAIETVAARVFIRTMTMLSNILLWHYTIKGGFNLFKDKDNEHKGVL